MDERCLPYEIKKYFPFQSTPLSIFRFGRLLRFSSLCVSSVYLDPFGVAPLGGCCCCCVSSWVALIVVTSCGVTPPTVTPLAVTPVGVVSTLCKK